jgi:YggT family protein
MRHAAVKLVNDIWALTELFLVIRIFMKLFSANPAAPIVSFLYGVTDFLLIPVNYIFPTVNVGGSTLDLVAIAGMILYAIFFYIAARIVRVLTGEPYAHPTKY